jgi:hypothetical protein
LARNFATPCLGREPKARFATLVMMAFLEITFLNFGNSLLNYTYYNNFLIKTKNIMISKLPYEKHP